MAGLTGLFKRGGSFYIRIVLPERHPLKQRYANGNFVQTLGPCSYRDAVLRGTMKRAEVLGGLTPPSVQLSAPQERPQEAPQAPKRNSRTPTLRQVFERWKVACTRSDDSIAACGRAVTLCEQFLGTVALSELTRDQGDAFRAFLLTQGTTPKTAHDRLTWVKSVLKYAKRDLGVISGHPWEGIDIAYPKRGSTPRKPWTDADLQRFFSQPLHTSYELPRDTKAGRDAAYWIPLLGIYTGARVGELAQLSPGDVDTSGTVPMLCIRDEEEWQRVKTEAGIRRVPIHSELIRLGFLDYAAIIRANGEHQLWPQYRFRKDKPGAYFSAWFGQYRRTLTPSPPKFHELRHTVRTRLREAGVEKSYRDLILGHEQAGEGATYEHHTDAELRVMVERLSYSGLRLQRTYKV